MVGQRRMRRRRRSAVRWLRFSYRVGAAVDAAATVTWVFPHLPTGPVQRSGIREGDVRGLRYGLGSGAALMAGWTALLMWADRRPWERRDVLAITAVPVVAGLMASDALAERSGIAVAGSARPVRALQALLLALFGFSWLNARGSRSPRAYSS